jgi:exodeoxyribonuclease VII large subunit
MSPADTAPLISFRELLERARSGDASAFRIRGEVHRPRPGDEASGAVWCELVQPDGRLTSSTTSIEAKLPATAGPSPEAGTVIEVTGTLVVRDRDFTHQLEVTSISPGAAPGRLAADVRRQRLASDPSLRPSTQAKLAAARPARAWLEMDLPRGRNLRVTFIGPRTSATRADIEQGLPSLVSATWKEVSFWKPDHVAAEISAGASSDADLIVLHRGGGGWRDWIALDDMRVLLAVATSDVPVVTAIGHAADRPAIAWLASASFTTPTAVGTALRRLTSRVPERGSTSTPSSTRAQPDLVAAVDRCVSAEASASARAIAAEREASARIAEIHKTAGQHLEAEAEARRAAADARRLVVQAERSFALHRIQVRAMVLGLVAAISTVVVAHGLPAWLPAAPWYASVGSAVAALTAGTAGTVFLFQGRSRALTPPRRVREGLPRVGEDAWLFALRHAQSPRQYRRLHGSAGDR